MKTARNIQIHNATHGEWTPNIKMFCCQCTACSDIDTVGFETSDNITCEVLPCAGKIDALRLIKAFEGGADGVVVVGCQPGSCSMVEGGLRATKRAMAVRKMLDEIGLDGDRIQVALPQNNESVESIARSLVSTIRSLGPSALSPVTA